jgi:hypothetical protein
MAIANVALHRGPDRDGESLGDLRDLSTVLLNTPSDFALRRKIVVEPITISKGQVWSEPLRLDTLGQN